MIGLLGLAASIFYLSIVICDCFNIITFKRVDKSIIIMHFQTTNLYDFDIYFNFFLKSMLWCFIGLIALLMGVEAYTYLFDNNEQVDPLQGSTEAAATKDHENK